MMLGVNWFIPVNHRDYDRMSASIWIRCLQLMPYLEALGVRSTVNAPDPQADISIFVRWQDRQAYELARQQKRKGQRVIFDLVVNYFDKADVPYLGKTVTQKHIDEALRMLSVADVVTCASAYIARRAREFHPWVEYLSDSIDRQHFCYTKAIDDFYRPQLRAIWSGVAAKAHELEPILPLLQSRGIALTVISQKHPHLRLPGRFWKRKLQHRFILWQYKTFPEDILDGDICVVHRSVDNTYNQGHSLFKIGVFMAQGVPAIASPLPSYQELLEADSGGHVCHRIDEWEETLDKVLTNRSILIQWSCQAQQVTEPYLTQNISKQYLTLFKQLCG